MTISSGDYVLDSIELIKTNVSAEQFDMFQQYVEMILQWNKRTNITSKHNAELRIYDFVCEGIALTKLLPSKLVTLADIGSGAGFPGLVLNILGYENCSLVEINAKKAAFLQHVVAELNLTAKVFNQDVREVQLCQLNYIVSKAVTNIDELFEMCRRMASEKTKFILCKNNSNNRVGCEMKRVNIGSKAFRFVEHSQLHHEK
jgi:16S rRNA (guanine(527)-N(7))-methyltransferase RsmG